eukprot:1157882-Pelagomonas_calceolata.AAC.3
MLAQEVLSYEGAQGGVLLCWCLDRLGCDVLLHTAASAHALPGCSCSTQRWSIAEMFMQHPKMEQVKLKDRKGFVRIAVEEVRKHGSNYCSGKGVQPGCLAAPVAVHWGFIYWVSQKKGTAAKSGCTYRLQVTKE